jgi:hypothetical protein
MPKALQYMCGQETGIQLARFFSMDNLSVVFSYLRWQQAPDHIKGHEPQYWTPLHFNSDGSISKIDWIDKFTLDVTVMSHSYISFYFVFYLFLVFIVLILSFCYPSILCTRLNSFQLVRNIQNKDWMH